VVSDSEDDPDQPLTQPTPAPAMLDQPTESTKHNALNTGPNGAVEENRKNREHPVIAAFDKEQHDIANDHPTYMDEHQEYMKWHYKLNHASERVMTKLAHKGNAPNNHYQDSQDHGQARQKGPNV